MALANRNILRTPSALRSGALTGLAQIVLALAAAGAGALLAHKFGRTSETDGFLAAYANGHGIVALAWGLAVNAGVALGIPLAALLRKRALGGPRAQHADVLPRLWHLLQGASIPLALQGCYLLALRFAAQLGVGSL